MHLLAYMVEKFGSIKFYHEIMSSETLKDLLFFSQYISIILKHIRTIFAILHIYRLITKILKENFNGLRDF